MKMEIELTDEQYEKVKILEDKGLSVGDSIDALFEVKESLALQTGAIIDNRLSEVTKEKELLEKRMDKLDKEISFFTKMKDSSLDSSQKQKIVEKEYGQINKTYDETIQNAKHKFKWSKAIFKL
ncbi:hypothetical protein [Methanobrevibacter sp.]